MIANQSGHHQDGFIFIKPTAEDFPLKTSSALLLQYPIYLLKPNQILKIEERNYTVKWCESLGELCGLA